MARGGLFGRIGRAVRNIIAPSPPPREREREQPPPEPIERSYRQVWRQEAGRGRSGSYRKNLAVFNRLMDSVHEDDPNERARLWESYVENIVNAKGKPRRQSVDNLFWRDSGIDPTSFKWQDWREAMGYTGKRRSRTP